MAAKHPIHSNNQIINSNILYLNEIINKNDWKNKDLIFISTISVYDTKDSIIKENSIYRKGHISFIKIFGES